MWPLQSMLDQALALGSEWGPFLLLVATASLVTVGFARVLTRLAKYDPPGERFDFLTVVLRAIQPLLLVAVFSITFWVGLRYFDGRVPPDVVVGFVRLQMAMAIFLVAWVGARGLAAALRQKAKKETRWQPAATLGVRVAHIVIYVVALLVILGQYDVEITPVLTSLGIAGLAVALALQDTLANFFAGLWIQTGKSLWPGHYIKVEDKNIEGYVLEVGWRTSKLKTLPGNVVIIPNSVLAQSTITDYFLPNPSMGTSITLVVGLETDPDRVVAMVLDEIRAAIRENDYMQEPPAPAVRLNRRTDNGWEIWAGFWVRAFNHQWNAQGAVWNRVRKRFLAEGIRMPYPVQERIQVPQERPDLLQGAAAAQDPPDGAPRPGPAPGRTGGASAARAGDVLHTKPSPAQGVPRDGPRGPPIR